MVNRMLGPREIPYVTADGKEEIGTVLVIFGETRLHDLEDGDHLEQKTGWVDVEFDGETHRFSAEGADDLQLVYYLMDRAGLWLTITAQRRGITLFDYRPEPVVDPMDIFDC